MTPWGNTAYGAYLLAETVLGQIAAAVVVTDRLSNLLYANAFAVRLFDFPEDPAQLVGRPILSLGFDEGDVGKATELAKQVLRGRAWDGTFATVREDGSRILLRAQAVPLRHPSGAIDGIVIIAREAVRRSSQRERDQIGLLERIGERLAGSLELSLTLRHVAETLVPYFADHCVIDLFHGEKLMRRVQMNANGWTPPPESWARVGDPVDYPEGHFCQQAMGRLDAVLVENLRDEPPRAPTQGSLEAARSVGLASVIAAPLLVRGQLLGVMSLAMSNLTEREDQRYGAGVPDQPAAPEPADARRARGGVPLCAGEAAGDPWPGDPDSGGRRLVRHHPAVRRPGGHRHRRRGRARRPRCRHHGPAAGRVARVRAGRQATRRDLAQAR